MSVKISYLFYFLDGYAGEYPGTPDSCITVYTNKKSWTEIQETWTPLQFCQQQTEILCKSLLPSGLQLSFKK